MNNTNGERERPGVRGAFLFPKRVPSALREQEGTGSVYTIGNVNCGVLTSGTGSIFLHNPPAED